VTSVVTAGPLTLASPSAPSSSAPDPSSPTATNDSFTQILSDQSASTNANTNSSASTATQTVPSTSASDNASPGSGATSDQTLTADLSTPLTHSSNATNASGVAVALDQTNSLASSVTQSPVAQLSSTVGERPSHVGQNSSGTGMKLSPRSKTTTNVPESALGSALIRGTGLPAPSSARPPIEGVLSGTSSTTKSTPNESSSSSNVRAVATSKVKEANAAGSKKDATNKLATTTMLDAGAQAAPGTPAAPHAPSISTRGSKSANAVPASPSSAAELTSRATSTPIEKSAVSASGVASSEPSAVRRTSLENQGPALTDVAAGSTTVSSSALSAQESKAPSRIDAHGAGPVSAPLTTDTGATAGVASLSRALSSKTTSTSAIAQVANQSHTVASSSGPANPEVSSAQPLGVTVQDVPATTPDPSSRLASISTLTAPPARTSTSGFAPEALAAVARSGSSPSPVVDGGSSRRNTGSLSTAGSNTRNTTQSSQSRTSPSLETLAGGFAAVAHVDVVAQANTPHTMASLDASATVSGHGAAAGLSPLHQAALDVSGLTSAISRPLSDGNGTYSVTLAMHPSDLGHVQAVMTLSGSELQVALSAHTEHGHAALALAVNDLKNELSRGGVNVNIDLRQPQSQSQSQTSNEGQRRPAPQDLSRPLASATSFAPAPAIARDSGQINLML
jgi:hypothetical protein